MEIWNVRNKCGLLTSSETRWLEEHNKSIRGFSNYKKKKKVILTPVINMSESLVPADIPHNSKANTWASQKLQKMSRRQSGSRKENLKSQRPSETETN